MGIGNKLVGAAGRAEIVRLLMEGWEMGSSTAGREPQRYWLQQDGLCRGGASINIYGPTARAMIRAKEVLPAARRHGDAFWLVRYRLPCPSPTSSGERS